MRELKLILKLRRKKSGKNKGDLFDITMGLARSLRNTIIELHTRSKSNREIAADLSNHSLSLMTIYRTIRRYKETATASDRPRKDRPLSKRTNSRVKRVREKIRRNPVRSMRLLAKEEGVCHKTMQTIVKKDLGLRPYKKMRCQLLLEAQKAKRLSRGRKMLKALKSGTTGPVMYTDEKLFDAEAAHNAQNQRALSKDLSSIDPKDRIVTRTQKPTSVMVWAGVTSDGRKTPLLFIEQGVKVNQFNYKALLEEEVLPWVKENYGEGPYTFSQDGAPSHTSRLVQAWCRENFSGFWDKDLWPPSSPDINPMDFSIRSILESRACAKPHANREALKRSLEREWAKISEETVRAACAQVKRRLEALIRAKGGHFEQD